MNRSYLAVIGLRLLAIYHLISGLSGAPAALSFLMSSSDDSNISAATVGLSVVCSLITWLAIWFYAPGISMLIVDDIPSSDENENDLSFPNTMSLGLLLLGFYVISRAIPALVRIVIALWAPSYDTHFDKSIDTVASQLTSIVPWSDVAAMTAQIGFGVWLILGFRGIVTFILKARFAGRPYNKSPS